MKLYVDNVVLECNFFGKKVNCKDNFNCYVKICEKKIFIVRNILKLLISDVYIGGKFIEINC